MKGPIPLQSCYGLVEEETCDTALLQKICNDKIVVRITLWQNLGSFFLLGHELFRWVLVPGVSMWWLSLVCLFRHGYFSTFCLSGIIALA